MLARKHLSGCQGGQKVLFSRNFKPGIVGLGIAPKEVFLGYSTHFVFLTIRLVPGSMVMVAIDMHRKRPITGEWIYGISFRILFRIFIYLFALFVCFSFFLFICLFSLLFQPLLLSLMLLLSSLLLLLLLVLSLPFVCVWLLLLLL